MNNIESHDRLRQIRQAKSHEKTPDEYPEAFTCPIEGCSRTVIGNPGDLRNHVRQSADESHQYRTLTKDLEVETAWHEMDWGPGPPV